MTVVFAVMQIEDEAAEWAVFGRQLQGAVPWRVVPSLQCDHERHLTECCFFGRQDSCHLESGDSCQLTDSYGIQMSSPGAGLRLEQSNSFGYQQATLSMFFSG